MNEWILYVNVDQKCLRLTLNHTVPIYRYCNDLQNEMEKFVHD